MSRIPKTTLFLNMFTFFWLLFSRHGFGAQISASFMIFCVFWGLIGALLAHLLGSFFGSSKKGLPDEFGKSLRGSVSAPQGGLKDAT